jgi:hypothetical protein
MPDRYAWDRALTRENLFFLTHPTTRLADLAIAEPFSGRCGEGFDALHVGIAKPSSFATSTVWFPGASISRNSRVRTGKLVLAGRLVTDRAAQDRRVGHEERQLVSCWTSHPGATLPCSHAP